MVLFLWNVFLSLRSGAPAGDDPWEGNTLEWATTSPPPAYNFDHLPEIRSERPVFDAALRPGGRALSGPTTMTTDDRTLVPVEHNPLASMPHDTHGGISNPVLGMLLFITSEVMFFGGLFAAYFNIRANAAQWPPINPETAEPFHRSRDDHCPSRRASDDPADHQLVHLPDGGLGDPARRPDRVHPRDGRDGRPRHRLPADAADRLRAPRARRG